MRRAGSLRHIHRVARESCKTHCAAAAAEYEFAIVDMPALFGVDTEITGRRLFLDYCHPQIEGLRRVARATAEAIAPALQTHLSATDYAIDPADEAIGHILAAIHNAHYGQPTDIVRHHCDRPRAFPDRSGGLADARRSAEPTR
jgi:hypothetical protein